MAAFSAALDAANPLRLVPANLPLPPKGRTLVIGGGKAAAAMAKAVEDNWPPDSPLSGLVATRFRHGLPGHRIEVIETGHPMPDDRGARAAQRMLDEVRLLDSDDLLLVLLSGGGSSLLALPAEDIPLEELREVTRALLASGAAIQDINIARKHLTRFSGGQVAALSKAPVLSLIISDVVGNGPAHIASGPCAPDPSTHADALGILNRFAIPLPHSVSMHLERSLHDEIPDTPKPGNPVFNQTENKIIGSARQSLSVAEALLIRNGIAVLNLGEVEGPSCETGRLHANLIKKRVASTPRPFALLSGGETTVKVGNASGRGGRNTAYLLALGQELEEVEKVWALACDTDGIDGTEDNAGAIWTPDTLKRARDIGLNAEDMLRNDNAHEFFKALNDLVVTGPTRTNVNDFRLILVA